MCEHSDGADQPVLLMTSTNAHPDFRNMASVRRYPSDARGEERVPCRAAYRALLRNEHGIDDICRSTVHNKAASPEVTATFPLVPKLLSLSQFGGH